MVWKASYPAMNRANQIIPIFRMPPMAALFMPPKNVYPMTRTIRITEEMMGSSPNRDEMISIPGRQLATAEKRMPIEEMMEDSRIQGTEAGKEIGKEIDRVELIRNNMDELSIEMIARILRVEKSYVSQMITLITQYADEDDEQIAKRYREL